MSDEIAGAPLVMFTKTALGMLHLVIGIDEVGLDAIRIGGLYHFGADSIEGLPPLEVQIILKSELRSAMAEAGFQQQPHVRTVHWRD